MKFKSSKLALKYCKGKGVELGGAAHNPFNLENCINIAPKEREKFWKKSQIDICGKHLPIDLYGTAEDIPVDDQSCDYVVSSHVIEHVPNPIKAFFEWTRVLKPQGIVFMIFPKRNVDPNDVDRPLSRIIQIINQYGDPQPLTDEDRHIWIFDLNSMVTLIKYCIDVYELPWEIIETQETDDKVGNGHTIVARKIC